MITIVSRTLTVLRGVLYSAAFVGLWAWLAFYVRRFDPQIPLALPSWLAPIGLLLACAGGLVAAACIATFVTVGHATAVNHQVAEAPVQGRDAIRAMFASGFATARMTCVIEQVLEDGEWAILEWRDPSGLRGCGFFKVVDDRIQFQRGYWDKLTFLRTQGLPLPAE